MVTVRHPQSYLRGEVQTRVCVPARPLAMSDLGSSTEVPASASPMSDLGSGTVPKLPDLPNLAQSDESSSQSSHTSPRALPQLPELAHNGDPAREQFFRGPTRHLNVA